jgi:hypothetical protein
MKDSNAIPFRAAFFTQANRDDINGNMCIRTCILEIR